MDLYGNLAHSEFDSDLLVEETASYPRSSHLLANERPLELYPWPPNAASHSHRGSSRSSAILMAYQKVLVAKWLG